MSSSSARGPRTARRRSAAATRRGAAAAIAVAGLSLLWGTAALPQVPEQERCDLMENAYVRSIANAGGGRITYISGPVRFDCPDGTTIRADSAVEFSQNQVRQLIGSVRMESPGRLLAADRVNVSTETGRTQAWGSVRVEDREADAEMYGDTLVFLEERDFRPESQLRVWGERPFAVVRFRGSAASETEDVDTIPDEEDRPADGDAAIVEDAEEPPAPATPRERPVAPETEVDPDTVFADRLYLEGSSRFRAGGDVRIRRPELLALGDSLEYDESAGQTLLLGHNRSPARITGEGYELVGREVDLGVGEGGDEQVHARNEARLDAEDVQVRGSRIRVFLAEGEIDRLAAVHDPAFDPPPPLADTADTAADASSDTVPARPILAEARAEEFVLSGDSIDVRAPAQHLEQVVAVGRARGEALGRDSLNAPDTPDLVRRDWIEGDTVVAHFGPPRDSAADRGGDDAPEPTTSGGSDEPSLERLVATGNARSLYRMVPRDREVGPDADDPEEPRPDDVLDVESDTADASDRTTSAEDTAGIRAPDGEAAAAPGERPRPAIHYVVGDRITIVLRNGEVDRMEVEGQTRGIYLEPRELAGSNGGAIAGDPPAEPPDGAPDATDADSVSAPDGEAP